MYGATDWWTESISSDAPPVLTLHGSVDEITHVEAAYRLDKAARHASGHVTTSSLSETGVTVSGCCRTSGTIALTSFSFSTGT